MQPPRMRTLPEAFRELKEQDPNTCYTLRALRSAVNSGALPFVKVGNKTLIDLDNLYKMLSSKSTTEDTPENIMPLRKVL